MRKVCIELQKLPREVRNRLFDNADHDTRFERPGSDIPISQIIRSASSWSASPEGANYWINIYEQYGGKW